MKAGAIAATERYGTQFSASRAFVAAPPYAEVEDALRRITGRPTLLAPSTSLAHQAVLPVLVDRDDLVLVDRQSHASVQITTEILSARGARVQTVPHNDVAAIERKLSQAPDGTRVWLLIDGIYSMFGDMAPFDALDDLLARFSGLHLYVDDAHATGWMGRHGRGAALERWPDHPRVIVALSLNKCFACAGGALALADDAQAQRVRYQGAALMFSGPVQPPMLGAIGASAALHLSRDLAGLQSELMARIRHFNRQAARAGLTVMSEAETPMRYIRIGDTTQTIRAGMALQQAGFFVSTVGHPAVPHRDTGVRLSLTRHHRMADIDAVIGALAAHMGESQATAAQ
nr:aminotransferase class I/II-fold pyridoxal phosphate-dependent enzyme [Roseibacterium elongatum]